MKTHGKKLIAPIVISIITVLYLISYAILFIYIDDFPLIGKIVGGIVFVALAGVCVYVLMERIKEIRSGEEDDLSQY